MNKAFNASRDGCILHVLDHSWPILSGYGIRSRGLVAAQQQLGESIIVVTGPLHQLEDPMATEVVIDGVRHFRTPIVGKIQKASLRGRWPLMREELVIRMLRKRILEIIDEYPVRIVYAHSPVLCGLAGLQAARKKRIPFIYEIRAFWEDAAVDQNRTTPASVRYRLARQLETYVARSADAVTGISTHILSDLESRSICSQKLFHVPNGVDADRFSPVPRDESLARELDLGDAPVLGFFGSLYRYEGVSWVVHAAAQLHARGCRFTLLIGGRGEDEGAVRDAIRECGAAQYVRLIGQLPHEQILRYYSVVDVIICPRRSVRITELVTPLKPLEAMALEKPVLASSVGGLREVIEHERTGLLFHPEDASDFCLQAERLLASASLRKSLGVRGRQTILQQRDWKVLARKYQEIYDFALAPSVRSMEI